MKPRNFETTGRIKLLYEDEISPVNDFLHELDDSEIVIIDG